MIVVLWDKVRLFAIVLANPARKKNKSGAPTTYELSSANAILRWSASESIPLFEGRTPIASDEYHQQMQPLLSVIAARTGLSLYDLR